MIIERWIGFRVHKARKPKKGFEPAVVTLTKGRPVGLAVKILLDVPDELIEPRIEYVVAEPAELAGNIEIKLEGEDRDE